MAALLRRKGQTEEELVGEPGLGGLALREERRAETADSWW